MTKKICTKCGDEKDITEYRKDRNRSDGRNSHCRLCARSLQSKRYKEKYSKSRAVRDKKLRNENRQRLTDHKIAVGCKYCPEKESICLEFHHIDMSDKDFGIASNTHRTWSYLEKEISKCVVVCSNCHRKVHANLI